MRNFLNKKKTLIYEDHKYLNLKLNKKEKLEKVNAPPSWVWWSLVQFAALSQVGQNWKSEEKSGT